MPSYLILVFPMLIPSEIEGPNFVLRVTFGFNFGLYIELTPENNPFSCNFSFSCNKTRRTVVFNYELRGSIT